MPACIEGGTHDLILGRQPSQMADRMLQHLMVDDRIRRRGRLRAGEIGTDYRRRCHRSRVGENEHEREDHRLTIEPP